MNPFRVSQNAPFISSLTKIRSNNVQQQLKGLEELVENCDMLRDCLKSINDVFVDLFKDKNDLREASSNALQCFVRLYGRQPFLEAISEWLLCVVDTGKYKHRVLRESVRFCELCDYLVTKLDFKNRRNLSLKISYELVRKASELEQQKAQHVVKCVTDKILDTVLSFDDLMLLLHVASVHPDANVFREYYSKQLKHLVASGKNMLELKWKTALKLNAFDESEFKKDSLHICDEVFCKLLPFCNVPETVTAGSAEAYRSVYNASVDKNLCAIHFINHGALGDIDCVESLKITDYSILKDCEYSRVNYLVQNFFVRDWAYVTLPQSLEEHFFMHSVKTKIPIDKDDVQLPLNCTKHLLLENISGVRRIVRAAILKERMDSSNFSDEDIAQALPFSLFVFSYEYFSAKHVDMLSSGASLEQLLEIYCMYPNLLEENIITYFLKRKCFGIMNIMSPNHRYFIKKVIKDLDSKAILQNLSTIPDIFKLDFYAMFYKELCRIPHLNSLCVCRSNKDKQDAVGLCYCKENASIVDCIENPNKYFYALLPEYADREFYSHVFNLKSFDCNLFYENACAMIREMNLPTLKYTDEYFYMNSYFYKSISLEGKYLDLLFRIHDAHYSESTQGLFFTFVLQSILGHPAKLRFFINKQIIHLGRLLGHKKHFVMKYLVDFYNQGQIDSEELLLFKDSLICEYLGDTSPHTECQEFNTYKKAYAVVKSKNIDAWVFEVANPRVVDLVLRECNNVEMCYIFRSDYRLLNNETLAVVHKRLIDMVIKDEGVIPQILHWSEELGDELMNTICTKVSEMMFNNYNLTRFDEDAVDSEIFDIFIEPIRGTPLFWSVFLMSVNKVRNINFLFFVERCLKKNVTFRELAACIVPRKNTVALQNLSIENKFAAACIYLDAKNGYGYSERLLLVLRLLYFNFPVLYRSTLGVAVNIDSLLVEESKAAIIQGIESKFTQITEGHQLKFIYRRDDVEYSGVITYKGQSPSFKTTFQPKSLLTLKINELLRKSYKFMEILSMWKVEVDNKISGQSECPICYLVLDDQGGFPSLKCKTCRTAYHKSCFFQWRNKIKKSECAICRQAIKT